ncbi:MAG: RlmE family RNA methyltransferase [Proteobacteria bacterium]|nr:RlmE family RNA methyltransferase [Pseudomonadota bacterium]
MGLSKRRSRHDRFYRRARQQGYRARAVFKLEEIDQKFSLIDKGARVLDLGCAPGSWLQYCSRRAGRKGVLVGVDRHELAEPIARARLVIGDIYDLSADDLLGDVDAFDVVLSDMAPDTTGIRHVDQARSEALFERALDIAEATLAPGGNFVGKLFQGPEFSALIQRCRRQFDAVKIIKPEGSRTRSIEQYVVARGYQPK